MKTKWTTSITAALSILVLSGSSGLAAETLPGQPFENYGVIDEAPDAQGTVLVSDTVLHMSDQTQVLAQGNVAASASDLKRGTKIGYNSYGTRANRYISDIWILPNNFDFKTLEED